MSLTSILYLLFILVTGTIYFIVPKKSRWTVLLGASIIAYVYASKVLALVLLFSVVTIYFGALLIGRNKESLKTQKALLDKEQKKALKAKIKAKNHLILTVVVLLNLGILAFIKYFNFFGETMNGIFDLAGGSLHIPLLKLVMPLGISFYTLQAISYIVDVYRGKVKADKHFGRVMLFMTFFPQMIEGPIGRYDIMAHQLYQGHSFDYDSLQSGFQRLIWGFIKKLVIADRCAILVNTVFDKPGNYSGIVVAVAVVFYTIQIYAEFSGAMDIVLGTAKMFGIEMMENFRQPFFSTSIQEFWRRWHITLGAWLRDYVFYSVSLSKGFVKLNKKCNAKLKDHTAKLIPLGISLFCVWLSNGIWHGASWKYICYGLYYYIIIMLGSAFAPLNNKLIAKLKINVQSWWYKTFQIARTCLLVVFGMLIFRAKDLSTAFSMFASIFKGGETSLLSLGLNSKDFIVLFVMIVLFVIYSVFKEKDIDLLEKIRSVPMVLRWLIYVTALLALVILGIYGDGYNVGTFIYGQF